ncbi:MAG: hypothetical protein NVSMB19_26380 [Vulcanimicrobiaceae bacterium]
MEQLIAAVKKHALAHYESRGGWDIVIECFEDAQIADVIHGARTANGAIKKMRLHIRDVADYRRDIQGA